ncbi:hypothetical protein BDZ88DRAFT_426198 [Geranomyces variabilis]|nr:hypothetical protein BDZ88DRAFT_426198 [Geranomyces variabilis]
MSSILSDQQYSADDALADYLDSITNLPSEVSFNMRVLRDLDHRVHALVGSMRNNSRSYTAIMKQRRIDAVAAASAASAASAGGGAAAGAGGGDGSACGQETTEKPPATPSKVPRSAVADARGALSGYRSDYRMAVEQSDRKLDASQRLLDQFSSHVSRLEKMLEKHEAENEEYQQSTSMLSKSTGGLASSSGTARKRKRTATEERSLNVSSAQRRQDNQPHHSRREELMMAAADDASSSGAVTGSEDEHLYCTCNNVSYGSMVACDNERCPIEWFHYACVGLTAPPKGAWFCKACTAKSASSSPPLTDTILVDEPDVVDIDGDEDTGRRAAVAQTKRDERRHKKRRLAPSATERRDRS